VVGARNGRRGGGVGGGLDSLIVESGRKRDVNFWGDDVSFAM